MPGLRTLFLFPFTLLALLSIIHWHSSLGANQVVQAPDIQPNLRDTLATGLKARLPKEFAFIDLVVSMVEDDELPLKLVHSTFLWARKQPTPYPFPYFERGLRIRAARIGVVIP